MKTKAKKTSSKRQALETVLERATVAAIAADKAVESRDLKRAIAAVSKCNALTCEALALGSAQGQLNMVQNLMPNAVFYTRVLSELAVDPFDAVARLKIGSSINASGAL